jgi:hypothetical protein
MTADVGTQITHWLAVGGATCLAVGSGIQATSGLAGYRAELDEVEVRKELDRVFGSLPVPGVGGILFALNATLAIVRIAKRYGT